LTTIGVTMVSILINTVTHPISNPAGVTVNGARRPG